MEPFKAIAKVEASITDVEQGPSDRQAGGMEFAAGRGRRSDNDKAFSTLKLFKDSAKGTADVEISQDQVFDLTAAPSSKLWDMHEHRLKPGQLEKLPRELRMGPLFSFPAVARDRDATRSDYLQVSFTQPCKVYLLLVEGARVPPWVKARFREVPRVRLEVEWRLAFSFRMTALLTQKLEQCKSARLVLWEGDRVYPPNRPEAPYPFGSMGGSQLMDYIYIFLWRPLTDAERRGQMDASENADKASMYLDLEKLAAMNAEENRRQRQNCLRTIMGAIENRNYEDLQRACSLYTGLLAAVSKHAAGGTDGCNAGVEQRCRAPSFLHPAGPAARDVRRQPAAGKGITARTSEAAFEISNGGATSKTVRHSVYAKGRGSRFLEGGEDSGSSAEVKGHAARRVLPAFLTRSGRPLTAVAAEIANMPPRLVVYLVSQGAELDDKALRFIISNAKVFPVCGYRDMQHFVLSYIWSQRNPIACAMVFALHLREASLNRNAKSKEYSLLAGKLRQLAVRCTEKLEKLELSAPDAEVPGSSAREASRDEGEPAVVQGGQLDGTSGDGAGRRRAADAAPQATLEDVLAPRGIPCSINDAQTLQVAYDTKDTRFMSTGVVQSYRQERWVGAFYAANALQYIGDYVHFRDHHMALRLLRATGFVGSLGQTPIKYLSYLLHIMLLASRPFFESPRGRWAFRLMCEVFLLYTFHAVQLMRGNELSWQHWVLVAYVASMIVDELQELRHQYKRRLAAYLADGFNFLEAVAVALLIGAGACKTAMIVLGENDPSWSALSTAKDFLFNTAPIFMWMRLLQFIIPLLDGLGALLMVISKMVKEMLKFAVPGVVVMTGVAFTLYATFRDREIPELRSFPNILLLLFRTILGETMFDLLYEEDSTLYRAYGTVVVVLFALASTVVLANLLIAIMSFHYDPAEVESQSLLKLSEILQHYEYMVEQHLLCAPFTLPLMLTGNVLPSGRRPLAGPMLIKLLLYSGLQPPDGIPLTGRGEESVLLATGSNELPHLVYLLTLYPVMMCASWVLCLAMAPYCIGYFTLWGCHEWLPSTVLKVTVPGWSTDSHQRQQPQQQQRPQQPGSGVGPANDGADGAVAGSVSGVSNKVAPEELGSVADDELLDAVEEDTQGGKDGAAGGDGRGGDGSSNGHQAGSPTGPAQQQQQQSSPCGKPAVGGYARWNFKERLHQLALLCIQSVFFAATRPMIAAVGAVVYLGLLAGFVSIGWLGVYMWFWRLSFSIYCVLGGWLQVEGWFGRSGGVEQGARSNAAVDGAPAGSGSARIQGSRPETRPGQRPSAQQYAPSFLDHRWVRVNQAALKNRGQVITQDELEEAMLYATFTPEDVREAKAGAALGYGGGAGLDRSPSSRKARPQEGTGGGGGGWQKSRGSTKGDRGARRDDSGGSSSSSSSSSDDGSSRSDDGAASRADSEAGAARRSSMGSKESSRR